MLKHARGAALLGLGLLTTTSCDWRAFDEAVETAPVRSVLPPSGFASRDVGRILVALPPPPERPSVAARLLAVGTDPPALAVIDFDGAGRSSISTAGEVALGVLASERTPASGAAVIDAGRVLLGVPGYAARPGRTALLDITTTSGGQVTVRVSELDPPAPQSPRFGRAVAVGHLAGTDAPDHLVLSDDQLTLMEDGRSGKALASDPAACPVTIEGLPATYEFRALVAGDLMAEAGDEVVVGVPRGAGVGHVLIFRREGAGLVCPLRLVAPDTQDDAAGTERRARFGASLAIADFDGDGHPDLVVGAPPDRAYLYRGPLAGAAQPAVTFMAPETGAAAGEFGFRVAAVDVDGQGAPEIVVGAPDRPSGNVPGAGSVHVYRADGSRLVSLVDRQPEARGNLGFSLAALPFAGRACGRASDRQVIAAGAIRELFVYFRVPNGAPDPRCFDGAP